MTDYRDLFVLDACIFPEGDFTGIAEDIKKSPLNAFFLTVSGGNFRDASMYASKIYQVSDRDSDFVVAKSVKDLQNAKECGKIAGILYFQDPGPIENDIGLLRIFYEMGIRVIQISYNKAGYMGTGCAESKPGGLSDFGRMAIASMNELGILVDLSHCCEDTIRDSLKYSSKPVTICHANIYNIAQNPRNKSDEILKLLAESDGVLGLTPWAPICWKGKEKTPPTIDDFLDHVDYAVKLIGIDHVGFGSDNNLDHKEDLVGIESQGALYSAVVGHYNSTVGTDPRERHAIGFSGATDIENLIQSMKKRGYKDDDICKFLGGNFLRVLRAVWR